MNKNERKGKHSGNKSQGFLEVVALFRRASVTKAFEKLSWEEQITKGNKVENNALNVWFGWAWGREIFFMFSPKASLSPNENWT